MSGASQFALLGERRFAPFFATQFLGAANDNVFKYTFTLLVTFGSQSFSGLPTGIAVNLIAGVFIVPFLLFSATSGQIADKFDKSRVMRAAKLLEVLIVLAGAWGFVHASFPVLLACTFFMGLHSTLFGPVKFAYLPQVLQPEEIVGGNGLVEMGTFVAILLGTMLAGDARRPRTARRRVRARPPASSWARSDCCRSGRFPRCHPRMRRWSSTGTRCGSRCTTSRSHAASARCSCRCSASPGCGSSARCSSRRFPSLARDVLGGGPTVANLLLAVFTVGVAIGALGCESLSRHQVEIGLVPLGSIGMTAFTVDLYFATRGLAGGNGLTVGQFLAEAAHWRVLVDLFLLAVFAGFYSVPLYALIQTRGEATHRARIIAANNILNALFLILAAGFGAAALGFLHWSVPELFLATAMLNLAVAVYIYSLVPEFLLRLLSWLLVSIVATASGARASSTFPRRAPRSSSATTCRSSTRSCSWG